MASERSRAIFLLALCGVFWSTAGVLIMHVQWHPLAIWGARCGISGLSLWFILKPSLRKLTTAEWGVAVTHALTTGLFIFANKLTTPANAILIQYSAPVWVAILAHIWLDEKATIADGVTIVVVLGGIALFFINELEFSHLLGNFIALLAGIVFATNTVLLRSIAAKAHAHKDRSRDPLRAVIVGDVIGVIVAIPFYFATPGPSATGWAMLLILGLVQQTGAYLCYGWAIRRVTALTGLLVPVIEPVLSPVWVMLWVGQAPSTTAIIGGSIVIVAVVVRALWSLRVERNSPSQAAQNSALQGEP